MIKDFKLKQVNEIAMKRFSPEELFFGLSAVVTVLIPHYSIVPALSTLLLLAFYYLFFGWFIFRKERKINFLFSIIAGMVYSICLISLAVIIVGDFYKIFFYSVQLLVLILHFLYLNKIKGLGLYKNAHLIRIGIILFLNLWVYIGMQV